MSVFDAAQTAQSVYSFWLGLVPQFINQLAKPASATQQSLQTMANALTAGSPAGVPNLFAPWGFLLNPFAAGAGGAAGVAHAATATANAFKSASSVSSVLPLQQMSQAWIDIASQFVGATPAQLASAFERTYGALSDALGLGPARKLQAAWQDLIAAGMSQQEARANYGMLMQRAFADGVQRLTVRLAEKADAGERVDTVLAFIRLWAFCAEEVVHETLQSEAGLAATAALARSALTYRKNVRHVAAIVADLLDIATRQELDEAFREIQELKRELRRLRRSSDGGAAGTAALQRTRLLGKRNKTARTSKDQGT